MNRETEKGIKRREQQDRQDEKHINSVLYFLLGILLSTCITAVSIAYALPKLAVQTEDAAVSAVTSELVEDTINASLGDYLSMNKISLSDESMEEITQYIAENVSNQMELTENELSEVKNLITVSIQNTNQNINTNIQNTNDNLNVSMTTMQEFVVNGDNEIADALKEYIDNYVVPGITFSLEMNAEDIVTVNETITEMVSEYYSYCDENETNLSEIIAMLNEYQEETEEYQTELTEKIDNFHTEYDSYVAITDEKIKEVRQKLNEYVTIAEFNEFQVAYEKYKSDMDASITEINDALNLLEEKKADKETVEQLTGNFENLKSAYDAFTGADGDFYQLTQRVTNAETVNVQNSADIAALEARIADLEQTAETTDGENRDSITALETRLSKFYPVGSVYLTFGNENPADLYGGTWEKVEDTFLMCAGSSYPVGSTGGSNSVTLNTGNIPSLNVTGNTAAKTGVTTSNNGSYDGTITTSGTYTGGTYTTSTNGEHRHGFDMDGSAIVVGANAAHPLMEYTDGFAVEHSTASWACNVNKNYSSIALAGNHSHTVNIPSQTISSSGNLSIGNHNHTLNIPALTVTGNYTNTNLQSINITNKYVAVNVWKRVA